MHEQSRPRPSRAATPSQVLAHAAGTQLRQRAARLRAQADRLDALADSAFRRSARAVAS